MNLKIFYMYTVVSRVRLGLGIHGLLYKIVTIKSLRLNLIILEGIGKYNYFNIA